MCNDIGHLQKRHFEGKLMVFSCKIPDAPALVASLNASGALVRPPDSGKIRSFSTIIPSYRQQIINARPSISPYKQRFDVRSGNYTGHIDQFIILLYTRLADAYALFCSARSINRAAVRQQASPLLYRQAGRASSRLGRQYRQAGRQQAGTGARSN